MNALDVPCPVPSCGAAKGKQCVDVQGKNRWPHRARVNRLLRGPDAPERKKRRKA